MGQKESKYFSRSITINNLTLNKRVDIFLYEYFLNDKIKFPLSRSKIQEYIKEGAILVNEILVKPSYNLKNGDKIFIKIPLEIEKSGIEIKPEEIKLDIIYFDRHIILVDKPDNIVVHPAYGHYTGTLLNGLAYYFPDIITNKNLLRYGIVHRLDKDVSGLMVIARNEFAQHTLVMQFKKREVEKEYWAIVKGNIKIPKDIIHTRIGRNPLYRQKMTVLVTGGKEAITEYSVIDYFRNYTLVRLSPKTGRTHQLRVHMNYIGHPIVGDKLYSKSKTEFDSLGIMLFSKRLKFFHPVDNKVMEFSIKLPEKFKIVLEKLRRKT